MQFDKSGTDDAAAADLSHRYLWGRAVDQILADEFVDNGGPDDVLWTLTDHLNTVRDQVAYHQYTQETVSVNHITYDAYGKKLTETNAVIDYLFGFTGRLYDEDTALQNNLNRWYDAEVGRWLSEDPIGFEGGDDNLYCYVSNGSLTQVDPSGQMPPFDLIDDALDKAELRRGNGPWKDSAQHCWAACYFGAVYGAGTYAAILADFAEIIAGCQGDWWRDIKSQHYGAMKALLYMPDVGFSEWGGNWKYLMWPPQSPEDFCDSACDTWA